MEDLHKQKMLTQLKGFARAAGLTCIDGMCNLKSNLI